MRLMFTLTMMTLCVLVNASAVLSDDEKRTISASDLVERVLKTYKECKSYRDSAVEVTKVSHTDGELTKQNSFTTAFVRPDRFRFEYQDKLDEEYTICHIIWRHGSLVRTWWDVDSVVQKPESLDTALTTALGKSGRAAQMIPALLMPAETTVLSLASVTGLKRIDDAKIGKTDCFLIEGNFIATPITIWIDKESYLVRRIVRTFSVEELKTEVTTTYEPIVDEEIAESKLEINHPDKK